MNYDRIARVAKRLIDENGRTVTFSKLAATPADATKPWRGAAAHTPTDPVTCKAAFVIGNTAIPTESRGLAFDWVDEDLLKSARHVVIVAALGLPDLENHKMMVDAGKSWSIIWGQCLQPATQRLLYVFGLKE